jgi:beta-glucosidase
VFASVAVGEGMDRASLALPGDQDRLIAAVAAANPRTVVVLNTGGPVLMPWLDQVAAVVQAWLPGQQFGEAVAAVLFGDADPGGRLPVTFPASPDQGPITGPERYPGVDGDACYDEGVLVGYRWFDQHGQEPLFPFGHGLSYGEYAYGQPRVTLDEATGAVTVSLQVTNVGARPGAEVVQLYLAAPAAAQQPPRQLKGFAKLHLDPGATGEMSLRLERDDLATFDEASGEWVVHPGRYEVLVGRSSRDLRGRAGFEVGVRAPVPR